MRIEHTERIDAPAEIVWDLTVDVENWPRITPTTTKVQRLDDGPLRVGSSAEVTQPRQRSRTWTVDALEPTSRFVWSTTMAGMTMTASHHLDATAEGTHNTLVIDLDGPVARLLGPMIRPMIRRAIATENAGFKQAAESIADRRPERDL